MTRNQRITYLALAALVAVAALLLRPAFGDDEQSGEPAPTVTASSQTAEKSTAPSREQAAATPPPATRRAAPILTADQVTRLKVAKGDTVRFAVRSPANDEVHVHGYDHSKPVPAGETVRMSFVADIEGIFEIELERAGTLVAELEVRP